MISGIEMLKDKGTVRRKMDYDFKGKRIFLTGGSGGIGMAISQAYARYGGGITAPSHSELDLSNEKSIQGYLEKDSSCYDIFIHSAGVNTLAGIEEINGEIMEEAFYVNCIAPVILLNRFVKGMRDRKAGKIIFISSLYASISRERRVAYSASKNALTGIMKSMALELAQDGIMVNCVAPGYVMTKMTQKNLSMDVIEKIRNQIPTKRFQTAEEIADMALFLTSDKNRSITGQLITVDGGFLCR